MPSDRIEYDTIDIDDLRKMVNHLLLNLLSQIVLINNN